LVLVAIALCAVGPAFVDSSDLDARWVNAIAVMGVGTAVLRNIHPGRRNLVPEV